MWSRWEKSLGSAPLGLRISPSMKGLLELVGDELERRLGG